MDKKVSEEGVFLRTVHPRHSQNARTGLLCSYTTIFAHKMALPSSLYIPLIPHASMIINGIYMMSELKKIKNMRNGLKKSYILCRIFNSIEK